MHGDTQRAPAVLACVTRNAQTFLRLTLLGMHSLPINFFLRLTRFTVHNDKQRAPAARWGIWFLFWAFDTKILHDGYFLKNELKISTFFAITFVKLKIEIFWFFCGNNSPILTFKNKKIENALKRSGTWWHR
jgi:hypothetical protein